LTEKQPESSWLKKDNVAEYAVHSWFVCSCNLAAEMLDDDADFNVPVDIFAIGFEEIVDLSAGNIVSARSAIS